MNVNLVNLWKIDSSWTLLLDRDGVINVLKNNDYIKSLDEFEFIENAAEAIVLLGNFFGRILVVTNQQGVAKGLMSQQDLNEIHAHMTQCIEAKGGRLDKIYACTESSLIAHSCRKPSPKMAQQAKHDFPEIDFRKSIMIGDSTSDIEFGKNIGAKTIKIGSKDAHTAIEADFKLGALAEILKMGFI